jgi:hypothetical protein
MDDQAFQYLLTEVDAMESSHGIDMNQLLNLSTELSQLLSWMVRQRGFQAEDVSGFLSCDPADTQILLERLISKSLVEEVKDTQMYQVQVAPSRASRKYRASNDVWKVFD